MNYLKQLILAILSLLYIGVTAQNIIHVKPGGLGNGTSWPAAYGDLQLALSNANSNDQIWVAAGTYKPSECVTCDENDRATYFNIPTGVQVYGGFGGTETQLEQRNPSNFTTVLSGDIGNINDDSDNAFTVVFFSNASTDTKLDGFTITKGTSDGNNSVNFQIRQKGGAIFTQGFQGICQPTIANCIFIDNYATNGGGAIHNLSFNGSNFTQITNCIFDGNESMNGGAIFNTAQLSQCSPDVINSEFKNNFASSTGGCIYNFSTGSDALIGGSFINCLFYDNYGFSCAGVYTLGSQDGVANVDIINSTIINNDANIGTAVYVNASDGGTTNAFITNSIIWNNTANFDPIFHYSGDSNPQISINHSIVDSPDCNSLLNGVGNIACGSNMLYNQDPQFLNLAANDAHLDATSPALDFGTNSAINATGITEDLDGNARIFNSTVDLGVFEFDGGYIPPAISIQPSGGTFCEGASTEISIGVSGSGPFTYEWFFNNSALSNSNSSSLSLANLTALTAGNYTCEVTGPQNEFLTSNTAIITIENVLPASVNINADVTNICEGEMVTFSATPQNGGSSPFIQWQVNNEDTGATGTVYTTDTLNQGDIVTCTMFSSLPCVNPGTSLSNSISINVNPLLTTTLDISADDLSVCAGTAITFTANASNQGNNPTFQWTVNNVNVGDNTTSIILDNLNDGDVVNCTLTSDASCVENAVISANPLTVTIEAIASPSISIQTNTPAICNGQTINFTSSINHGGSAPSYIWQVNNVSTSETGATFSSNQLNDGDVITCMLTSNANCTQNATANSNEIQVTIDDNLTVSASIQASSNNICQGENIEFTATLTNAGANPTIEWLVNNSVVAQNTITYNSSSLNDGDMVTLQVTSSLECTANPQAMANALSINVTPNITSSISIETEATLLCENASATIVAVATNEGNNPTYEWFVNGVAQMNNETFLVLNSVENGATVTANLMSDATCLLNETASSNQLTFEVVENLEVDINIIASDTTTCEDVEVLFTSTTNNEGINPEYEWFVNGVSTSETTPFYQIATLSDQDIVTCQITSSETCTDSNVVLSAPITMNISANETLSIELTPNETSLCVGDMLNVAAITQNAGQNPVFLWQINQEDISNNTANLVIESVEAPLTINCMLLAEGECLTNNPASASIDLEVNELPEVTILPIDTICAPLDAYFLEEGQPTGGTYDGEFVFDDIFDPSMAGFGTHAFSYTYTDDNMCTNSATSTITVKNCVSTKEIIGLDLTVFPNPARDALHIAGENTLGEDLSVMLFNNLGQVVHQNQYTAQQNQLTIDLSELVRGTYFLRISAANDWSVYPIIVD